jgi:hypothetical protein
VCVGGSLADKMGEQKEGSESWVHGGCQPLGAESRWL